MPSTRFLFWNINRKPLAEAVADLAEEQRADVVVLAESRLDPAAILRALNTGRRGGFHFPPETSKRVTIFTRFSRRFLRPAPENDRSSHMAIRRLALPARPEILVVAVHLPSKLRKSHHESQTSECFEWARRIIAEEERAGHRRTVVLGDFNLNPFEPGLVAANCFNSVMSRQIASGRSRTVLGQKFPFFYNPMWGHLGDLRGHTAGSYFYNSSEHVNYYWNVFDQVLIRPELVGGFDSSQLRIVASVGQRHLVRANGRPNGTDFSDHLPIVFELVF